MLAPRRMRLHRGNLGREHQNRERCTFHSDSANGGCLQRSCSILILQSASQPVIRDKNRMHFYEKVIKVKADVAALHIFFRRRCKIPGGVESCQGRRFLAFICSS